MKQRADRKDLSIILLEQHATCDVCMCSEIYHGFAIMRKLSIIRTTRSEAIGDHLRFNQRGCKW